MTPDPIELLAHRVRQDPSSPLVTWYDADRGERVELSARTFANWVDKTANLLDELAGEAPRVGLPVGVERPGHWVPLVWTLATWQRSGTVWALPVDQLPNVDVAVVGPESAATVAVASDTIACSLHPLGLGLDRREADLLDYREVIAQPDTHWATKLPTGSWFIDADGEHGAPPASGEAERILVTPVTTWQTSQHLLRALAGGGSLVIVAGATDLAAIGAAEHARPACVTRVD